VKKQARKAPQVEREIDRERGSLIYYHQFL